MKLYALISSLEYICLFQVEFCVGVLCVCVFVFLTVCIERRQRKMLLQGHRWKRLWPIWLWPIRMSLNSSLCNWSAVFLHWNFDIRQVQPVQVYVMMSSDCSLISSSFCYNTKKNRRTGEWIQISSLKWRSIPKHLFQILLFRNNFWEICDQQTKIPLQYIHIDNSIGSWIYRIQVHIGSVVI